MTKKKVTLRTIAEMCGVSVSTVSLVINNKPGIRPEVRSLVLQTTDELGWHCNSLQNRMDRNQNVRSIAFVVSSWYLDNGAGNPVILTLSSLIEKLEDSLFLPVVYYGRSSEALSACRQNRPHAVFLINNNQQLAPQVAELQKEGVRVIILHAEWNEADCCRIHSDHRNGGYQAALKLKEQGCQHPAFSGGFGARFRCEDTGSLSRNLKDYLDGVREVYPDFDLKTDLAGEPCNDPVAAREMYLSGRHDGWIFQQRIFFDGFQFLAEENGTTLPRERTVVFDTSIRPVYPLAKYHCLMEDYGKIAEIAFNLATTPESPAAIEYTIPYIWNNSPLRSSI